jgi:peptide/nickel transport system substrate-binding protein
MTPRALLRACVTAASAVLVLIAPSAGYPQKRGAVLRVGLVGEPPTLDAHWTTAAVTSNLGNHLSEGLYTLDENRRPMMPLLAESLPAVSRDGLIHTIKLGRGIKFHNGTGMTAEEVVAARSRWGGWRCTAASSSPGWRTSGRPTDTRSRFTSRRGPWPS